MLSRNILLICLAALTLLGAEDPWVKVRELKSGQELRILRRDAKQSLLAKMDEATADSLVVVMKDEQVSIPKDQIDRLDARPVQKTSRVTRESKTTATYPDRVTGPATQMNNGGPGQSVNSSSSLTLGGKPDFELVYRRPIGVPVPAAPAVPAPK